MNIILKYKVRASRYTNYFSAVLPESAPAVKGQLTVSAHSDTDQTVRPYTYIHSFIERRQGTVQSS